MQRASMRRIHRATGLFPLAAYLLFHAWEHWPVRASRDALFARLAQTHHGVLEVVCVLLPLCVHAALGLVLARHPEELTCYASPAFRRLQAATGVLTAGFIVLHLAGVWLPRLAGGGVAAAYMSMCDQSGTALGLALHVVGLGAVCSHLGQGLGCALSSWCAPRVARGLGVGVGVLLWLVLLNELAVYATYAPLL